jgi:hypothetical protein
MRSLGVTLVTTPNFSLFIDQPRWDDLHSQKAVMIAHEEFLSEGLPAALHVDARTPQAKRRPDTCSTVNYRCSANEVS